MEPEEHVLKIMHDCRIDVLLTLPCERIKALLSLAESEFSTIHLTREDNGVGICAGVYMAGRRPLMIIQSTGIGNMINSLLALNHLYNFPLPIIASWRGIQEEAMSAHIPLGEHLQGILNGANIKYTIVENANEVERVRDVINDSFNNKRPHVALMLPNVWKDSKCKQLSISCGPTPRIFDFNYSARIREPIMTRYDAISVVVSNVDNDDIIISNLGAPCKELYDAKDRPTNFYMRGSLGLASSIGFGLALFSKKKVYVLDGDGSLLMNPNALLEIAVTEPTNLTIICLDNSSYGTTGNQQTCSCSTVDLELFAKACGIKNTVKIHTKEELAQILKDGYAFVHAIIKPGNKDCKNLPLSPREIKERFMKQM
ncbi:MAG: sulfopyruvate decarboxylase subunit beta [Candidatus Methanoperedens sp.]|nr:sulfopyruvate decarboxylase subunit beta [Candidatus Methanoperedens sp.]